MGSVPIASTTFVTIRLAADLLLLDNGLLRVIYYRWRFLRIKEKFNG
jgi:hypothetical protein